MTKSKSIDERGCHEHGSEHISKVHLHMRSVRILVANEPRAYREVFASTLQILRPEAEIVEAKPEHLDREVKRFQPDLVLCSNVSPLVQNTVRNWILLYPENEPSIMIFTSGELSTVGNVDLEDLISLVDRTAEAINNDRAPTP